LKINYSTVASEHLASYRYRIKIPSDILRERGHEIVIGKPENADVGVFSKHFNAKDAEIARQPTRYSRVVFDVCDYHLDGVHRDHYERMMGLADLVTVGTEEMRYQLLKEGYQSTVIQDPYEFEEQEPEFDIAMNLLWFGHPTNLAPLVFEMESGRLDGYWLKVISQPNAKVPCIPWSMENMKKGLKECDVVIIPQEDTKANRCKGANRMVESIRSGRFVVANNMPAYEQFKEWMFIGDIQEGLEWVKENRTEVLSRILEAQKYVQTTFNPEEIANQWQSVLTSDVATSASMDT